MISSFPIFKAEKKATEDLSKCGRPQLILNPMKRTTDFAPKLLVI